jgi:hypothetical protein
MGSLLARAKNAQANVFDNPPPTYDKMLPERIANAQLEGVNDSILNTS